MNFAKGLEKLFTGFAVDADTKLLSDLAKKNDQHVFIIKKSKYFITLMSLPAILTIFLVACVNIGLFFFTEIFPRLFQFILGIGLGINVLRRFVSIFSYLNVYNKNYGIFKIMAAKERIPILEKGDTVFRKFFNQTIGLILGYIAIILIFIGGIFFLLGSISTQTTIIIAINMILFVWQFHQIIFLLKRFINLEMDFVIVNKDQIKHYDQQKFGIKTKTLDTEKVKVIKSNKTGKLRSILDYGEVHIFTEGNEGGDGDITLKYIIKPEMIEKLLYEIKDHNENTLTE